ncbi:hypothetical protein OKW28_008682 [Paraburkholderia sp. 40]
MSFTLLNRSQSMAQQCVEPPVLETSILGLEGGASHKSGELVITGIFVEHADHAVERIQGEGVARVGPCYLFHQNMRVRGRVRILHVVPDNAVDDTNADRVTDPEKVIPLVESGWLDPDTSAVAQINHGTALAARDKQSRVGDADAAVSWGPGLRWGIMGPSLLYHLGGGQGGIEHFFDQFTGPLTAWWHVLGTPELTPDVRATIIKGVHEEAQSRSQQELATYLDEVLMGLLRLRDKE